MDGPLCSEEYEALDKLGKLLREPAKYGVTIERGSDLEAAAILNESAEVLRTIWSRRASKFGVV